MKPLISVFIPTHARYRNGFLEKAIDSILAQTYTRFELFVVDDGSVDGTQKYLQKLSQRDNRVKHIRFDRNIGLPALTLFKAYLQSKGEFIAFRSTTFRRERRSCEYPSKIMVVGASHPACRFPRHRHVGAPQHRFAVCSVAAQVNDTRHCYNDVQEQVRQSFLQFRLGCIRAFLACLTKSTQSRALGERTVAWTHCA